MAGDTPSIHSATCRYLVRARGLQNDIAAPIPPGNAAEKFREIISLAKDGSPDSSLSSSSSLSTSFKPKIVLSALSKSYAAELDFDKALFHALRKDLENSGIKIEGPTTTTTAATTTIAPAPTATTETSTTQTATSETINSTKSTDRNPRPTAATNASKTKRPKSEITKRTKQETTLGADEIVLSDSKLECEGYEYAIGFARQAKGKTLFRQGNQDIPVAATVDNRESGKHSEYDHVSCVFMRKEGLGKWEIRECFSVVELKMNNSSSVINWTTPDREFDGDSVDLLTDDPIVQEVDYVLESTWRCICRCGLAADLDYLPVALIAAQKENDSTAGKMQWVKARVTLPSKCGGRFYVQANGAEPFAYGQKVVNDTTLTVNHMAGLYFETMLFGFKLCKELKDRSYARAQPSPLAGKRLEFGKMTLTAALCGSPLLSRQEAQEIGFLNISQGELYHLDNLKVNLKTQGRIKWLLPPDELDHGPFLVKVWSRSVHACLQETSQFRSAIDHLLSRKGKESLMKEISKTLLGVEQTATGSITLMRLVSGDPVCLRRIDTSPTSMTLEDMEIVKLWEEFEDLVRTVLLPLAEIDLIHLDLRPGCDVTSNILRVQPTSEESGRKMMLIDWESLCESLYFANQSGSEESRYPRFPSKFLDSKVEALSFAFLHYQCAGMAFAWIQQVNAADFVMKRAQKWVDNGKLSDGRNLKVSESKEDIDALLGWLRGHVSKRAQDLKRSRPGPVGDRKRPAPSSNPLTAKAFGEIAESHG